MFKIQYYFLVCLLITLVNAIELPETCKPGQYFDPGLMTCGDCLRNSSMVPSSDGFICICEENSIPISPVKCKRCNATEVRSTDGSTCVPRRCQKDTAGRMACRKCPNDYVSVTQNLDGSSMREVQCVKCSRGYKAVNNRCVRCETCTCPKNHIVIRDKCVPKTFLVNRPKYEEKVLHPNDLLDAVKNEYLCTMGDARACRHVATACVRNFYTTDHGGPCRLWLQSSNIPRPQGLPQLVLDMSANDGKNAGEVQLSPKEASRLLLINIKHGQVQVDLVPCRVPYLERKQEFLKDYLNFRFSVCEDNFSEKCVEDTLSFVFAVHTSDGNFKFLNHIEDVSNFPCFLPNTVKIGTDFSQKCQINISDLQKIDNNGTLMPYLNLNGNFQSIPVLIRKPTGYIVQGAQWATNKFRRYFVTDTKLSSSLVNVTNTVYLQTLLIFIRFKRDKTKSGRLLVSISLEAQYASKSPLSKSVMVSINVQNELPGAGVIKGLEIWGGVLGALLALYAIVQWRGVLRRGGMQVSLLPLMSGCVSDTLHFAALFSTLHALAAEAGTLGLTLPLSRSEEHNISALIYAALSLKIIKVVWVNWKQCSCDVFFLDWSEYLPAIKEKQPMEKQQNWKLLMVAKEWRNMQTTRRVNPGYTTSIALLILHFMTPWRVSLPQSHGYKWVVGAIAWWSAYTIVLFARWLTDRVVCSPSAGLPKVCSTVGVSLLVFEEEYYAHYVHGRNDDLSDARALAGPLSSCRVMCAPQLRIVFKQLSSSGSGSLGDAEARQALLSRFLSAFFERALDGMSWVASERSLLERLLDVEVTTREASTTSALLYDPDDNTPSCFAMTWWCEEWSLATLDALVFGCFLIAGGDFLLASILTLTVWKISERSRAWFGDRNLKSVVKNDHLF